MTILFPVCPTGNRFGEYAMSRFVTVAGFFSTFLDRDAAEAAVVWRAARANRK